MHSPKLFPIFLSCPTNILSFFKKKIPNIPEFIPVLQYGTYNTLLSYQTKNIFRYFIDSMGGPTNIILLNGHNIKMTPNNSSLHP